MSAEQIVNAIKASFEAFTTAFVAFGKKAEFAIEFCQAFMNWQDTFTADSRKEATRTAFVRALHPSLPKERDKYRVEKHYMAADYLYRKGMKVLTASAKDAVSKGTASDQQKRIAADAEKRSKKGQGKPTGKDTTEPKGVQVSILKIARAFAYTDADVEEVQYGLEKEGIGPEVITAIIAEYSGALKTLRKEAAK